MLPLYLCGLVIGIIQTWPLLQAANRGDLHNPFLENLAGNQWDALVDLSIAQPAAVSIAASGWLIMLPLLTLLFGGVYNFFSGGIISVWLGKRSFWSGCRRTFWAFTGLGVLLVLLAAVSILIGVLLGGILGRTGVVLVTLVLLQIINVVGEYARSSAIVEDRRNPFVLLAQASKFCVRHGAGVAIFALLGILLHVGVLLLYRQTIEQGDNPLVIIAQQLLILAWIWIKLLRLAWATRYVSLYAPTQL